MKRIKSTVPDGGAPLGEFPTIRELFDTETKDAIESLLTYLLEGQTEGCILSGCVASGSNPNATLTVGWVFLNGKALRIPTAPTGHTYPFYIAEKAASTESGTFGDGVSKAWIDVEEAEAVVSAPGAGQYITINGPSDANQGRRLPEVISDLDETNIMAWTAGTNQNGATGTLNYYKGKSGIVYLRGVLTRSSDDVMCNIPADYRPQSTVIFNYYNETVGAIQTGRVESDGDVVFTEAVSTDECTVFESGCHFRQDS